MGSSSGRLLQGVEAGDGRAARAGDLILIGRGGRRSRGQLRAPQDRWAAAGRAARPTFTPASDKASMMGRCRPVRSRAQ
jgi:hypothetical protein